MTKIAFLFPGQGAQAVGMGEDFYNTFAEAREIFDRANDLLSRPLSKVIFEGPAEELTKTSECQTGIFVMSVAVLATLRNQFSALFPSVVAGLSLGEYTALFASGRLSFEGALNLVDHRGRYMSEACDAKEGTMAAIFGLSGKEIEHMVAELSLPQDLWAANFNSPSQTVISGTKKGVAAGIEEAKNRGAKRVIPLQVHGAFHSGLMDLAEKKLAPIVDQTTLNDSEIDLIMNVPGDFVSKKDEIKQNMVKQVTHPVRWEDSVKQMEDVSLFVEIGPGRTLGGLNKKNGNKAPVFSVGKLADLDELSKHVS